MIQGYKDLLLILFLNLCFRFLVIGITKKKVLDNIIIRKTNKHQIKSNKNKNKNKNKKNRKTKQNKRKENKIKTKQNKT